MEIYIIIISRWNGRLFLNATIMTTINASAITCEELAGAILHGVYGVTVDT